MKVRTCPHTGRYGGYYLVVTLAFILFFIYPGCKGTKKLKGYPETRKEKVEETLHGVKIADPYRWLEKYKSPEAREWIEKQNKYTSSLIGSLPFFKKCRDHVAQLRKIENISTPIVRKGRYFFTRRLAYQDLPIIYMQKGPKGKEEALLDPHPLSPDHTTSYRILEVSPDGTILVYGEQQGGEDAVSVHLFDVEKRKNLPDVLPKAQYISVSMKPDNSGLYFTRDESSKGARLYYHKIGTDPEGDIELFGKGFKEGTFSDARLSEDCRYLLIHVYTSMVSTEIYYINTVEQGPIVPIINNIEAQSFGTIVKDQIFIHTNWKAAKRRVLAASLKKLPQKPSDWREIIPESDAVIESFSMIQAAGGKLFIKYIENAVPLIKVFETDGKHVQDIRFPVIGTVNDLNGQWESSEVFFSYSSYFIPNRIYRYDAAAGRNEIWAQIDAPIESGNIRLKQVWYDSKDGTRIPMFLAHREGIKLDGSNPTILTGYGGFNVSYSPRFISFSTIWLEKGGVFASPGLRGGGEFGEEWHRAGVLDKKQTVFDDFIAAAEWLIQEGYTKPEKLAIWGASNGGLLVGAAFTQRPGLFKAAVCQYPLLDMIRYHKFLGGSVWIPEYGSPEVPEQLKYLVAYSPYHNVKAGVRYPAVLFLTGDADTRVAPLHALKMTALLQNMTGSPNPVLLYYDTTSGHAGGQPVSKQIEETAHLLSFIFWQLDVPFNR